MSLPPLYVVLGPTCSGKTAYSIALCTRIGGEVVNADSRQLYRGLDIGTAKITEEEKEDVPHHLFDVLNPEEEATIAWYKEHATCCIEEIQSRGTIPVLVGGSMLYISSIIDGLEPLPPVDPALRGRLEQEYDIDGGKTLYAKLLEIDPETASAFHPNNKPYVIRAMELFEATGDLPSQKKTQHPSPYDLHLLGMQWDRETLTKRIEGRTEKLLQSGWVEEVVKLQSQGHTASSPAMKSHGYREVLAALERYDGDIERVKHDAALIEVINAKTRQYAKRQMTWWKHDERIEWIKS